MEKTRESVDRLIPRIRLLVGHVHSTEKILLASGRQKGLPGKATSTKGTLPDILSAFVHNPSIRIAQILKHLTGGKWLESTAL